MNFLINSAVKFAAKIFRINVDTAKSKTFVTGLIAIGSSLVIAGTLWNQGNRNIMDYKDAGVAFLFGLGMITGRDAITKLGRNLSGDAGTKAALNSDPVKAFEENK
jgi:hypothetical protein